MTSDSKNETEEVNKSKYISDPLTLPTERNSVCHNLKKNPEPYHLDNEVSGFGKPATAISPSDQRHNFRY
jgi:hypothetical protein